MPVLFAVSYHAWPFTLYGDDWVLFGLWLVFVVSFMVLAVYDLRWLELPNRVVYPLIALAVVQVLVRVVLYGDTLATVSGAFLGFITIGGLFYTLFQLSDGRWIGGGDVKLAFMIGPLVGSATLAMMVMFLASLMGTVVSLPFLLKKSLRVNSRIPFGPFLLGATFVVYLWGQQLVDWYLEALL